MKNPENSSKRGFIPRRLLKAAPAALIIAGLAGATYLTPPNFTGTPAIAAEQSQSADRVSPYSFADLVEKVKPSVVSIQVDHRGGYQGTSDDGASGNDDEDGSSSNPFFRGIPDGDTMREFFERFGRGQQHPHYSPKSTSLGSGFIISEDGYVVTNNHVVDGGNGMRVVMIDGTSYKAKLVGRDKKTDLALIKIQSDEKFTPVHFASKRARVGDRVVAVGNPFGLGGTVTTGIVSASGREIGSGPYDDYLQLDAAINRGNSGGPSFNLEGEVIGVNTAIYSPSGGNVGIGFAIPANLTERVISDIKEHGRVTRGWLGVRIQSVTKDLGESMGLDKPYGALVTEVSEGSPAMRSELKRGDTILKVDGRKVTSPRDLARKIAEVRPDTTTDLLVLRDGKEITKSVKIASLKDDSFKQDRKSHDDSMDEERSGKLGLWLAPPEENDEDGAMIADVNPDGPAADKGLRPGDVILEVNGQSVSGPDEAKQQIRKAIRDGGERVVLFVRSRNQNRFIAVPVARG